MNITLAVVPRSKKAETRLDGLTYTAEQELQRIFGHDSPVVTRHAGVYLYNSDAGGRTWRVPTNLTGNWGHLAFTMPPVSVIDDIDASTWEASITGTIVDTFRPETLSPNYFGALASDAELVVWTDHLGVGRCYLVENEHFIAVSNHIGILTLFSETPVSVDEGAVSGFVHFGWFPNDSTPISGIKRVPPATEIRVLGGRVFRREYLNHAELFGANSERADFDQTVQQMMTVNRNLDAIVNGTPTVFLSGGQDSRMTTATWLAGGASARVLTYGDLAGEAEVATELMRLYAVDHDLERQGVRHEVKVKGTSTVTMPLSQRLKNAFDMWDGDAPPVKIRGNVRPLNPQSFSVSGLGGEIIHGHYYGTERLRDRIRSSRYPLEYLNRVYLAKAVVTDEAVGYMANFMEEKMAQYRQLKLDWYGHLDYFFLEERMRRGAPQSLHTVAPIPLCVPEFQRMAFRLSVGDKVGRVGLSELVARAIPRWSGVETYKPTLEEAHATQKTGNRLWAHRSGLLL
ncbi:hypothetical protein [Sanguibacter sp. Z1732]|uniref:hypothetical protein n=1 Tax=Sanguibacter sp. Z1732 TaxID=3435412 RepID=UPI003D9CBA48